MLTHSAPTIEFPFGAESVTIPVSPAGMLTHSAPMIEFPFGAESVTIPESQPECLRIPLQ